MREDDIVRLNVERYRRLLRSETDESVRDSIKRMLDEFETKLSAARIDPRKSRDDLQC